MYCTRCLQSNLLRNGSIYRKRLVRFYGDYINKTYHHRIVSRQAHQLSPKHIQQINLKKKEIPNSKIEPIAIVVPNFVSKTNPVSTAVSEEFLKNDVQILKKDKKEDFKWTVTPSEDLSRLGKHYLMLSKSRLTCKTHLL